MHIVANKSGGLLDHHFSKSCGPRKNPVAPDHQTTVNFHPASNTLYKNMNIYVHVYIMNCTYIRENLGGQGKHRENTGNFETDSLWTP